ncbi:MAG: hypothetical protein WC390_07265 [Sulfurimonas sp.]|jgi:hypothetical protein
MPIVTTLISSKIFNQLNNAANFGTDTGDYCNNLVGCVGERLRYIQQVDVGWGVASSDYNPFVISGTGTIITRGSGYSFFTDGFSQGDNIYYETSTGTIGTAIISTLSDLQMVIIYDPAQPVMADGIYDYSTHTYVNIHGTTPLTSLIYKFGLIENSENISYKNKITNSDQAYYGSSVGADDGYGNRLTNAVTLQTLGVNKDWVVNGIVTCAYISTTNYFQRFEIIHDFIIPYYKEGELTNLQNNQIPDLLLGLNSLKYIFEQEFRTVLTNPNTAKKFAVNNSLGCTGWFGESFNGFNNIYSIYSLAYTDYILGTSVDSLQPSRKTRATIFISKSSGSFNAGDRAGIMFSVLQKSSNYENTTTNFETNFIYDNIIATEGASATTGINVLKLCDIDIIAGKLRIIVDFEFSTLQQLLINDVDGYIIGVLIADNIPVSANSDRVMLLANLYDNEFNFTTSNDIDNLIEVTEWKISSPDMWTNAPQWTSLNNHFIEDNTKHKIKFWLDRAFLSYLNSLQFGIIAYNSTTNDYFILDKYDFDIAGNSIVDTVNDIQYITIDDERGYNLAINNLLFQDVTLEYTGKIATKNYYEINIGQKISWQEWLKQIDANPVFYDSTKEQNNLNKKASVYSNLNGYDIKFALITNCNGIDNLGITGMGNYIFLNPDNLIYEYNEVSSLITSAIKIYHPTTAVDLGTTIGTNFNTLFKTTHTKPLGFGTANLWYVEHRIEVYHQSGCDIFSINSKNTNDQNTNSPLIPLTGETKLKLTLGSGTLISECYIDYTKLTSTNYKLSSRIIIDSETSVLVCILDEANNCIQDENGNILYEE